MSPRGAHGKTGARAILGTKNGGFRGDRRGPVLPRRCPSRDVECMLSGDPAPIDDLQLIIETKRHMPTRTLDVVSEASRWLKASLNGAGVKFNYASCEDQDHYGFSACHIARSYKGQGVCLELKVAEIRDAPYAFADVRVMGKSDGGLFPFFGDLATQDGRDLLLHYVADFIMSTEP